MNNLEPTRVGCPCAEGTLTIFSISGCLVILNFNWRQHINASMIRNKYLVSKTIDFFFDVYDSRFEVGYHRIIDGRMRQRLIDFFLEELSSLFEDRYVGSQHEALRLAKVI